MPAINKTKAPADRIKMKIRKGDTVQIISGKDKGKTGEVLKTLPYENRVLVQGINQRTCLLYTSPTWAYRRLEPKTLIHCKRLAPLLSATVKNVSC